MRTKNNNDNNCGNIKVCVCVCVKAHREKKDILKFNKEKRE